MSNYLWDKSGEPDAEVERLERALARFRTNPPAPVWPHHTTWFGRPIRAVAWPLAAAAVLLLVVAPAWFLMRSRSFGWDVARLEGQPTVAAKPVSTTARLDVGEWLETDGASRARIDVGRIGQVQVAPNTRIRLEAARGTDHRLRLQRGHIDASIWSPPRYFAVDTPSARAIDLGCVYSLEVDDEGIGTLRVSTGWVAFEVDGHESFVPGGAMCLTRPGKGPGTPYYEDAPAALAVALHLFDTTNDDPARDAALDAALIATRKRDAITLWHLLARTTGAATLRVYDRLAALVPPPASVTRHGIVRRDRAMLDAWWNEFVAVGILEPWDTADYFRVWKGPAPQAPGTRR